MNFRIFKEYVHFFIALQKLKKKILAEIYKMWNLALKQEMTTKRTAPDALRNKRW